MTADVARVRQRDLVSVAVGIVVAGAYIAVAGATRIPASVQYVLAAAIVLALPTSKLLSRRFLINGAMAFGWFGALWWLPAWFGDLGRVALVLGVGLGLAVGCSVRLALRGSVSDLVPRIRSLDVLIPLGGAAAAWMSWPLLAASETWQTMSRLMRGWDQAGHFSMILLQRQLGELPAAASGFDDTDLFYAPYSQYLHSVLNGLTELRAGPAAMDPGAELVAYGRSYSLLFILMAMLMIAGVIQLASLRRRPLMTIVFSVFAMAIVVIGPGGTSFMRGHLNIGYAAVALALLVFIAISAPRILHPTPFFACAGLIVGATGSWPLLGPVGAGLGVVAVLSNRRWRTDLRRYRWWLILIALVAALCIIRVAVTISGYAVEETLTLGGDTIEAPIHLTAILVAAAVLTAGWPLRYSRELDGELRRINLQRWSVFLMVAFCSGLALFQVVTDGQLSYYFWKLTLGVEIILVPFVVAGTVRVAHALATRRDRFRRLDTAVAVPALLLAFVMFFGIFTGKSNSTYGAAAPSVYLRENLSDDEYTIKASHRVLKAYESAKNLPKGTVTYYAVQPYDGYSVLDDHWMHAMLGDWSRGIDEAAFVAIDIGSAKWWEDGPTPKKIAKLIEKTLKQGGPDHVVIVAPAVLEDIRAELSPEYQDRLISW